MFKIALDRMATDNHKIVIRADRTPFGEHARQFNAQIIDEVAIVILDDQFQSRDIVIHRRNDQLQRVSELHRSYDALQYPILHWKGDDGYHINIPMIDPRTVKSIKYICKYVNKGSDMAVFGVAGDNRNDEITQYQMGRYISSNEAVWRIMSFPMHERHPVVVHLAVHLENGQRGLYFLDAPIGTGKTFVVSLILATIRTEQKIALALASSGIAATLLEGGRTAHSALKLPLNVQNYRNHDWLRERAILAPKNIHINAINFQIQAKLPGVVTTYKSIDSVMNQDEAMNYPIEFLNSLEPAGIPPHCLNLKKHFLDLTTLKSSKPLTVESEQIDPPSVRALAALFRASLRGGQKARKRPLPNDRLDNGSRDARYARKRHNIVTYFTINKYLND
ncbi:hypothetical protein EVAR_92263_1 [Eumeta japonica]|uniref:ATP-dependent DNA helicase n=1 Tax=Eumeta variegata TaxID=151549 RepID=A0A4C1TL13_EUMVA|nr:hypothetical protein EVAR_92263_1 [Eumeta japonica]